MPQSFRVTQRVLVPLLLASASFSAQAVVIENAVMHITFGWAGTAQTFTVPDENVLQDWTFVLAGREEVGSVELSVYEWAAAAPTGAALYSTTLAWGLSGGATGVSGINLALTPGGLYGVVIDLLGHTNVSVLYTNDRYAGGQAFWTQSPPAGPYSGSTEFDLAFTAVFDTGGTVPEPGTLALLGLGLAGLAAARGRSRQQ